MSQGSPSARVVAVGGHKTRPARETAGSRTVMRSARCGSVTWALSFGLVGGYGRRRPDMRPVTEDDSSAVARRPQSPRHRVAAPHPQHDARRGAPRHLQTQAATARAGSRPVMKAVSAKTGAHGRGRIAAGPAPRNDRGHELDAKHSGPAMRPGRRSSGGLTRTEANDLDTAISALSTEISPHRTPGARSPSVTEAVWG